MDLTSNKASPLVLVHGSLHGPWCFELLMPYLKGFSHVQAVDILACQSIHDAVVIIGQAIDEVLSRGDSTKRVVLLGHSLGGIAVSQAAEEYSDRICRVIYLTAYLPLNGESRSDIQSHFNIRLPFAIQDNTIIPSKEHAETYFYSETPQTIVTWAVSLLRPQPTSVLNEKVSLSDARFGSVSKMYIFCSRDRTIPLECQKWMVSRRETYGDVKQTFELATDHFPLFSTPEALGQIVSSSASSSVFEAVARI